MIQQIDKIDSLKFLGQTHTTVRQLIILSRIIKLIAFRQLPLDLININLTKWSREYEVSSPNYVIARGKITEKGKPTTAFPHYIKLLQDFKLLSNVGSIVTLNRTASVLSYFLPQQVNKEFSLTTNERLVYFYFLLKEDADIIITILCELKNNTGIIINQKQLLERLMNETDGSFLKRLSLKQSFSSDQVKSIVGEKLRKITYEWKKKEVYAEHIFVPRFEWLQQLGLVKISTNKSTSYKLTSNGFLLLENIPFYKETSFQDITENWLENNLMKVFSSFNFDEKEYTYYDVHNPLKSFNLIGTLMNDAFHNSGTISSSRIPLVTTALFVVFSSFLKHKLILEISQFYAILDKGFEFESKTYLLRKSARLSESYIIISHL